VKSSTSAREKVWIWCVQSKDTERFVLDQILSVEQNKETTTCKILSHFEDVAPKMGMSLQKV
jgi:hypothetical protein